MTSQSSATGAVLPYDRNQSHKYLSAAGAVLQLPMMMRSSVTGAARNTQSKNRKIPARAVEIPFLMNYQSSATAAVLRKTRTGTKSATLHTVR